MWERTHSQMAYAMNWTESSNIKNDIAVLRTAKPIAFEKNVHPIALPTAPVRNKLPVIVSGWGQTKVSETSILNYQ